MNTPLKGSCQCGQVRYSINKQPIRLNICHCTDCQKQSGSAFGMSLVVDPNSLSIESGTIKEFNLIADSGRSKICGFCPDCGVRIFNRTSAMCSIKAGTLDSTDSLRPDAQYWIDSKQTWCSLNEEIPIFHTQ